jgi:fucose 4-O-acetylase-like acetyltransferase
MSKTRDLSFDFIKGFLIFLVCWGHIIQFTIGEGHLQNETFMLIYSFHMPLFIMISGYFACKSIKVGGGNLGC